MNLMELAGYANISATACQISLPFKGTVTRDQDSDKKVFLPTYLKGMSSLYGASNRGQWVRKDLGAR